jgi:Putative adhesin
MRNSIGPSRRAPARALLALLAAPMIGAGRGDSAPPKDPLLTARHFNTGASIKIFNPAGAVRLVGWNFDSVEVRGSVSPRRQYFFGGDDNGAKIGIDEARAGEPPAHGDLTIFVPKGTTVGVKTVNGDISATDVSGWFYAIAGRVSVSGVAKTIEVEAMRGDVTLNVTVPWLHARGGSGRMIVGGTLQDVDVSTISGALDIASGEIVRGQFASVSGDIRFSGAPAAGAILDFSNHGGAVDLAIPRTAIGTFALSTVSGTIANGFARMSPVSESPRTLHFTLGRGGPDVTVRTFKGAIRVRPQ